MAAQIETVAVQVLRRGPVGATIEAAAVQVLRRGPVGATFEAAAVQVLLIPGAAPTRYRRGWGITAN